MQFPVAGFLRELMTLQRHFAKITCVRSVNDRSDDSVVNSYCDCDVYVRFSRIVSPVQLAFNRGCFASTRRNQRSE